MIQYIMGGRCPQISSKTLITKRGLIVEDVHRLTPKAWLLNMGL